MDRRNRHGRSMTSWPDSLEGPFHAHPGTAGRTDRVGPRSGRCRRVFAGVYVNAATRLTVEVRSRAALLLAPEGTVVARQTAAALWGGVVPPSTETQLSSRRERGFGWPGSTLGSAVHRERLASRPSIDVAGPDVRRPGRRAGPRRPRGPRRLPGPPCVSSTPEALIQASGGRSHVHRCARRAANLVRRVSTRPWRRASACSRAGRAARAGRQSGIRDEHGAWLARLDLAYPQWRIAIEYDGRQHAESSGQWHTDIGRREDP